MGCDTVSTLFSWTSTSTVIDSWSNPDRQYSQEQTQQTVSNVSEQQPNEMNTEKYENTELSSSFLKFCRKSKSLDKDPNDKSCTAVWKFYVTDNHISTENVYNL